jgi:hypothetical protein
LSILLLSAVYCNISALWVIDLSNFNWALAKSGVTKYRNTLEDVGERRRKKIGGNIHAEI